MAVRFSNMKKTWWLNNVNSHNSNIVFSRALMELMHLQINKQTNQPTHLSTMQTNKQTNHSCPFIYKLRTFNTFSFVGSAVITEILLLFLFLSILRNGTTINYIRLDQIRHAKSLEYLNLNYVKFLRIILFFSLWIEIFLFENSRNATLPW